MTQIALLDTTIVLSILHREPNVLKHSSIYILEHFRFCFSVITQFEALRGFYLHNSTQQHALFLQLCADSQIIQLDNLIIDQSALIYTSLYKRGQLIDDADILIAATALVNGWRLITSNERHMSRIPSLVVENWLTAKV